MLQVDERFEINAPRREVFALWTSFGRFPEFLTGVESVFVETRVRLRWRVSIAGVEPTFYAVITEFVRDERIAWTSVDLTTMGCWIDLEEIAPERTRVTVRVIWSPRGDAPWLAGARELDATTVRCDLHRFRTLLEGAVPQAA